MVATRQWSHTSLVIEEANLRLVSLRERHAWLDWILDIRLRLVENNILCYDLNQIVCGAEPSISLLNETTKDVVNVVVHLVAVPELLRFASDGANSVMASL